MAKIKFYWVGTNKGPYLDESRDIKIEIDDTDIGEFKSGVDKISLYIKDVLYEGLKGFPYGFKPPQNDRYYENSKEQTLIVSEQIRVFGRDADQKDIVEYMKTHKIAIYKPFDDVKATVIFSGDCFDIKSCRSEMYICDNEEDNSDICGAIFLPFKFGEMYSNLPPSLPDEERKIIPSYNDYGLRLDFLKKDMSYKCFVEDFVQIKTLISMSYKGCRKMRNMVHSFFELETELENLFIRHYDKVNFFFEQIKDHDDLEELVCDMISKDDFSFLNWHKESVLKEDHDILMGKFNQIRYKARHMEYC